MFIVGKTKTYFLQCKNHLFARQKPYFCNAKTTLLTSKRVVSVFYECGNRNTKLIEVRCRQTNFANGWLLFNAEFSTLFNCGQTNFANGWLLFNAEFSTLFNCGQTNFANGWLLFNAEFSTLFNCCQTNFANGWLLFPYSIAALLWLILLCASCPLLCKYLCSWRLHDVRRGRNVEHLHWFRVRLPTLLLCHRLWLLLPN